MPSPRSLRSIRFPCGATLVCGAAEMPRPLDCPEHGNACPGPRRVQSIPVPPEPEPAEERYPGDDYTGEDDLTWNAIACQYAGTDDPDA